MNKKKIILVAAVLLIVSALAAVLVSCGNSPMDLLKSYDKAKSYTYTQLVPGGYSTVLTVSGDNFSIMNYRVEKMTIKVDDEDKEVERLVVKSGSYYIKDKDRDKYNVYSLKSNTLNAETNKFEEEWTKLEGGMDSIIAVAAKAKLEESRDKDFSGFTNKNLIKDGDLWFRDGDKSTALKIVNGVVYSLVQEGEKYVEQSCLKLTGEVSVPGHVLKAVGDK